MEKRNKQRPEQRASALLMAIVVTVALAGMAGAMLAITGSFKKESVASTDGSRALYVAEAGLSDGIALVQGNGIQLNDPAATFGAAGANVPFGGGGYWGSVVPDAAAQTFTVTSFAQVAGQARGVEAVLGPDQQSIYDSALFAGNTSGDPLYDMEFGGTGVQADEINGNIYSGGNVDITGEATINGSIKASGSINGGSGTTGSLPVPDIAGMNYATNNDFNVKALFASATYKSNSSLGGSAWQLPKSSPAHIFRKNPSDRSANTSTTAKDDYFLEDPYDTVNTSSKVTVANATQVSLWNGGSDKVYYIDGNLWIHNKNIFSFTLSNPAGGAAKVTFVVNGNIYFSDNILYKDPEIDGIAFIAMKDAKVKDSGNIYFGDPTFGTLEHMDAFMYAENNFYDNNLSASGSATVTVNGNMTAGNQVLIDRDYHGQHSKLTVNFDDRISTGAITLPGLPGTPGAGMPWTMVCWREVPVP
jgi:hypothetical protein